MQKKNDLNTLKTSLNNNKNTLLLFKKKMSDNKLIYLETNNIINIIKHFSPANKEWKNSIYSYDKNIIKYLPIKDKILFNLIKSYFNLYNPKVQQKLSIKNIRLRFKRLSILNIIISKAEIKHTNSKSIITLYVYNRQKNYLINKLNNVKIFNKIKDRIKSIEKQSLKISEQIEKEITLISCPTILQNKINIYEDQRYKDFIKKSLEKEILIIYIKQLFHFNKSKFEDTYLLKLNNIIEKIYNKNVEFNIINLKYIHLNSDLLTQLIAIKLKRRKNYILKVLKKLFKMVKISPLNKIILMRYFEKNLSKEILNNLYLFEKSNNDNLNQSLFNLFSLNEKEKNIGLENLILDSLKYKDLNGLRLETKGRLSKRRTASKSVFKLLYKGSLKNIDSSYKGLSTIILRGYVKSNIQFTKLSSKTRNGSFGIKGWISSK
jgi:Mitochondrial ribosomal protein (VAR1)